MLGRELGDMCEGKWVTHLRWSRSFCTEEMQGRRCGGHTSGHENTIRCTEYYDGKGCPTCRFFPEPEPSPAPDHPVVVG
jgi:hypothetical protein